MKDDDLIYNSSQNPVFADILEKHLSRRQVLRGGLGAAAVTMFGGVVGCNSSDGDSTTTSTTTTPKSLIGFQSVATNFEDAVHVPKGYTGKVLFAWGDPVSNGPAFSFDAQNSAADQAQQAGMHHDGIHFFSLPYGSNSSTHGLLVMNHEYIDDVVIHIDGGYRYSPSTYSVEKANKELAAHGVSVIEVKKVNGQWDVVRPSQYARRVTGNTPMTLTGPAAGSDFLKTAADPTGREVLGTLNNCAHGYTPWGTYLTCEENFHQYFGSKSGSDLVDNDLNAYKRYGVPKTSSYGWETQLERFDLDKTPNEPNRFGWVVEFDPFDPSSKPVKHTAFGRFSHENVAFLIAPDKRVVFYSGDDARFEYIYKFVTAKPYDANNRAANATLLDEGTLYVAKFNADKTGEWLPLVHGQLGLTAENGFRSQAEVLVKTRLAADKVGATKMDRPEWITTDPKKQDVYVTLTNNNRRTEAQQDAANPRADNQMGHILRWRETGGNPTDTRFTWDIYVFAGSPDLPSAQHKGNVKGDIFACPDGLWMDSNGLLWIQTDMSSDSIGKGALAPFGNNQMLASDPTTGEVRRFLTGPKGCEVTGVIATPDMKTMFVNIQHPGETETDANPANPTKVSSWPNGQRPRSATVVIVKDDGGVIGS
ncbi:Tat pathway signal protein [Thioflexithrix psekupsensis]|uniref:Tat pathway signal protein n=2 Tax=Thioflexithrix psekupsensis TaxID=1570016 RepID=A0A251XBT1_9GAMM|nr:Tat pathway signal protein [Thioflexithrix psekupsensis]